MVEPPLGRLPSVGACEDADAHVFIEGAGGSRAACPAGDRNGRRLPLMKDLADVLDLRELNSESGAASPAGDFEGVYDELRRDDTRRELRLEIERRVWAYFDAIEIPETATAYDALLLSLRPKDLVATFNWDPLLVQAFQRHEGRIALPELAFLHGNVAVGMCLEHQEFGWRRSRCRTCGRGYEPTPLLYPVRDKSYSSHPFIADQWERLRRRLASAYFLTIFGYSAPTTDAAARELMKSAWDSSGARALAEVEIIDLRSAQDLRESWNDFIVRHHYLARTELSGAFSAYHPRRTCDALFAASMQNTPWTVNELPVLADPDRLREWVDPLWQEEIALRGSRSLFSGLTSSELRTRYGTAPAHRASPYPG